MNQIRTSRMELNGLGSSTSLSPFEVKSFTKDHSQGSYFLGGKFTNEAAVSSSVSGADKEREDSKKRNPKLVVFSDDLV